MFVDVLVSIRDGQSAGTAITTMLFFFPFFQLLIITIHFSSSHILQNEISQDTVAQKWTSSYDTDLKIVTYTGICKVWYEIIVIWYMANKANLRDLIAATDQVIILKLD